MSRPDVPRDPDAPVLIHAGSIVVKEFRRPATRDSSAERHKTAALHVHLHELCERMQSVSFYIEALRSMACRRGGISAIDTTVLDKAAKQIDQAQREFQSLCEFLFREEADATH